MVACDYTNTIRTRGFGGGKVKVYKSDNTIYIELASGSISRLFVLGDYILTSASLPSGATEETITAYDN